MNELGFKKLNFSVLGRDCEFIGELRFKGDTLVNSKIDGTISVVDEGKLTIERNAIINGEVYCHDVEVFGEVQGMIRATGKLIVRSSAVVSGNIEAKSISIYPGAVLNIEGHTPEQDLLN